MKARLLIALKRPDVGNSEWHLQEGIKSQSLSVSSFKFKTQDLSPFQTTTAMLLWVLLLLLQHTSLLNDLTAHVDQHEPDTQPESQPPSS